MTRFRVICKTLQHRIELACLLARIHRCPIHGGKRLGKFVQTIRQRVAFEHLGATVVADARRNRAGVGLEFVLAGAVEADAAAGNLAALSVEGVKLEKTFYVAIAKGLPESALPAQLAAFLTG